MFGSLMNMEGNWLLDEFERMQREMDALFNRGLGRTSIRAVARGSFPAINIGATPNAFQVYVYAPGLDTKTIDLSIQRNLLTISGARNIETPKPSERASYHLRERFNGEFRRVISLPDDIDPNQVNAVYKDGVLNVTVGKRQAVKPRQIQIKSA